MAHYLSSFFNPASIAVIGASERPGAIGTLAMANFLDSNFGGALYPVNPRHREIQGRQAYARVADIAEPVELAVVATPARTVPGLIRECGQAGIHAVVVLSAGFGEQGEAGVRLERDMLAAARNHRVRIIGPNCMGIMRPRLGVNATFSKNAALPGELALVSQSGALCTAILDWALERRMGFSALVSLGHGVDVGFGEILAFLAMDPATRGILLYVEGVHDARRFMSGLRAAARIKPVVVVKAGRRAPGVRAAMSHTGALVGEDDAFDAALARAGAVRADTIEQLFAAAEILGSGIRVQGERLAVITNGGGPGVMAVDRAADMGVALADFSEPGQHGLRALLPPQAAAGNPVDLLGDADAGRYREALEICLRDPAVDGVLALLTPQAVAEPEATARAVTETAAAQRKPVLACWMGGGRVRDARQWFAEHRLPHFDSPEAAVEGFSYLVRHRRNRQLLFQVPEASSRPREPDLQAAHWIIEAALEEGRGLLSQLESKALLGAFGIPVVQTVEARSASEALLVAQSLGFPVAMKINAPGITHKGEIGGVRLNISNAQAVRSAYVDLHASVARWAPEAEVHGVTVECMHTPRHGRELMVGVLRDPVFGPVISFGAGGAQVEVIQDKAVALPPLNNYLVRQLIQSTRVAPFLAAYRHAAAVDMTAIEDVLLRVSELVCALPQILEMDINPLIADEDGVRAVDARFRLAPRQPSADPYAHMAIVPYPAQLQREITLSDGTLVTLRPIRPEDAEMKQAFVHALSPQSRFFRFMEHLAELSADMLVRFTQIDYDREMALVATTVDEQGEERQIGVSRYVTDPDGLSCEFALAVADDWQGKGIGTRLMKALMEQARSRGLQRIHGEVLTSNVRMLGLMRRLGFSSRRSAEDYTVSLVSRDL
ncbi:GNAT family N-acetyltransferase [Alkalilimnicola sp. S0819]|uniref:bifunctional acetate--CoA ligase family protein/GNAT family N-acetyltransferase n=1 Tax=Alkalilimnicola sp. S0819 TaxID=2613922 RepID=UPI00126156BB|nr:GNAT family N-acetyltransferase [Alkalilimnicola sp. S0819]KAB7627581.1 GNAT family N-acetyltransferase [Alkalilimnicola sp. S0819]MPQ15742.1 GNAT family N-acetyltransferase [Alkalilimnicola sp. S0819]